MNEIVIKGEVISDLVFSHETLGEKFYEFKLESKRLSDTSDILRCIISEIYIGDIEKGTYLVTKAEIRTRMDKLNNKLDIFIFITDKPNLADIEGVYDLNKVMLEGYICKEPVYRKTPLGREITDFIVAINRPYGKSYYIPTIAWGRNAKRVSSIPIGSKIALKGRFQSREYQKRIDGEVVNKIAYEVSASSVEVMEEQ